jgi:hypothetical protein
MAWRGVIRSVGAAIRRAEREKQVQLRAEQREEMRRYRDLERQQAQRDQMMERERAEPPSRLVVAAVLERLPANCAEFTRLSAKGT